MRFCNDGLRWGGSFLLATALLASSRIARATPNFPPAVRAHLTLAAEPACTLCHLGTPGRGTVNTPFGSSARSRGLVAYDDGSLRTALDALAAENKDGDGDGVGDIRELRDGTDPNAGPGDDESVPDYGCGVTGVGASGSPSVVGALFALALLLALAESGRRTPQRCARPRNAAVSK